MTATTRPSSESIPRVYSRTNKWEDCKLIIPRADVVLDCGANVGQTARNLRLAYPAAEIYCFEPVRSVFGCLKELEEELRIHPVRCAVSDRNGRARINLTASPESNSLLEHLPHDNPLAACHEVVGTQMVRLCRLDDWCLARSIDLPRVDILKLDVQGHELAALEGADEILSTVAVVLLEVAFVRFYKDCPLIEETESFMNGKGFVRAALYPSIRPEIWADAMYLPNRRS